MLFTGAALLMLLNPALGQITYTWDGEGPNNNWSEATNWDPNGFPTAVDTVIISNGETVRVNLSAACAKLVLEGGVGSTRLDFNAGGSLAVSGPAIIEGNTNGNVDQFILIGSGSMSCSSLSMDDTGLDNRDCEVRIGSGSLSVTGNITMNGSQARNKINFSGPGTLYVGGSISGGLLDHTNTSTVNYNGAAPQTVRPDTYGNLTFSGGGAKTLSGQVTVLRTCTFSDGIVTSSPVNLLIISDHNNSIVSGASDNSFVNGPVRKLGNDPITFPTGKTGAGYAPIGISAPSNMSDITAEYFHATPPAGSLGAGIDHISAIEYWQLTRASGNSDEQVTLSWRAGSQVTQPASLVVAGLNAGTWANWGNGGTTGNATSGTITSSIEGPINAYFTLASVAALPVNPLPIELVSFSGQVVDNAIELYWRTATELDNDYMAVERSADGIKFEEIGRVKGSGTTQEPQQYSLTDERPLYGINYYRLRQVDFDGAYEYHAPISVLFSPTGQAVGVSVYPNPTNEILHVSWQPSDEQTATLRVLDLTGRPVGQYEVPAGSGAFETPVHRLPAGLYVLEIRQSGKTEAVMFRKE